MMNLLNIERSTINRSGFIMNLFKDLIYCYRLIIAAMKSLIVVSFLAILSLIEVQSMTLTPLYGYISTSHSRHYYTLNASFIGYAVPAGLTGRYSYRSEGITCLMETESLGNNQVNCKNLTIPFRTSIASLFQVINRRNSLHD